MAVELHIDDGDPWYLSPDIWVVPGNNPNGTPGTPVVNQSAYVWARVHNRGTTHVTDATVVYYWADPSALITRNIANRIGVSHVSLEPGETKSVLCITPWRVGWINNGHVCLIAEAFAPADPLPVQSDDDPIVPAGDRHVAQLNLNIAMALRQANRIVFPFAAGNAPWLHTEAITLRARRESVRLLEPVIEQLGLERIPDELDAIGDFTLQPFRCGEEVGDEGGRDIELRLTPGEQKGMALVVQLPADRRPEAGALFLVEQVVRESVVGGLGILVLSHDE